MLHSTAELEALFSESRTWKCRDIRVAVMTPLIEGWMDEVVGWGVSSRAAMPVSEILLSLCLLLFALIIFAITCTSCPDNHTIKLFGTFMCHQKRKHCIYRKFIKIWL